jgi:hypothetical protein
VSIEVLIYQICNQIQDLDTYLSSQEPKEVLVGPADLPNQVDEL